MDRKTVINRKMLELRGQFRELATVRLVWNPRMRTAAGRINLRSRVIYLNPRILLNTENSDADAINTLTHECAHMLAWDRYADKGHGRAWKMTHRMLGGDGERLHNLKGAQRRRHTRVEIACSRCGTIMQVTKSRWAKYGNRLSHRDCGGAVVLV